jgi:NADH-quinone oxidoreductase subunit L
MEGPTPVSAMIHAATMVSAGVYMLIRVFPLLSAGLETGHGLTQPMVFMAFIGTFTAFFSATIAIAQNDVKRVLAYSTISQLGFMIAALGIGGYIAATFHLVAHAFFKALLFLGSGSVIHGMEHGVLHTGNHQIDPQDMTNMGGLYKKMPVTFWTFMIGGFALSGLPLVTAGFWSKDEILADAWAHYPIVFIILAISALLTALYTMRQITLTFFGKPRTKEAGHAVESRFSMTVPLVVLAFFSITFGWVGIPEQFPVIGGIIPNWFHEFVGGTLLVHPKPVSFSWIPLLTSIVVSVGGLALGYFVYRDTKLGAEDPVESTLGTGIYRWLKGKYFIDELYTTLFVHPAEWVAVTFTSLWMDRTVIDGVLHWVANMVGIIGSWLRNFIDKPIINGFGDQVAESTKKMGGVFRTIQTGHIQQYMILALVSVAVVSAFFYYFLIIR